MKTPHRSAAIAACTMCALAPQAFSNISTSASSVTTTGLAESGVPVYDFRTLSDTFDGEGDNTAAVFTSFRDAIGSVGGGVRVDSTGAGATLDIFTAGEFGTQSVGTSSFVLDATWVMTEQASATLAFNSTWILGGGAGGPGDVTLEWSFAGYSGAFESAGVPGAQGLIDDAVSVDLDPGVYRLLISATASAPEATSRLALGFGLDFAAIPTPGSVAVLALGGLLLTTRRR